MILRASIFLGTLTLAACEHSVEPSHQYAFDYLGNAGSVRTYRSVTESFVDSIVPAFVVPDSLKSQMLFPESLSFSGVSSIDTLIETVLPMDLPTYNSLRLTGLPEFYKRVELLWKSLNLEREIKARSKGEPYELEIRPGVPEVWWETADELRFFVSHNHSYLALVKPLEIGKSWIRSESYPYMITEVVLGIVQVTVPAGVFDAYKIYITVEYADDVDAVPYSGYHYYVKGVGLVLEEWYSPYRDDPTTLKLIWNHERKELISATIQ